MIINLFNNKIKKDKGFTLLELLITIAIFSIVMVMFSSFTRDIFKYEDIFSGGLTSYDEARKILQPIASEIRSASPSSLGAYPIETAGETNFAFFADIDNDGLKERIRYFISGNNLMRGVIIPSGNPIQYLSNNEVSLEIIKGVNNGLTPIFTYYDNSYNGDTPPLTQPVSVSGIRLVAITLLIDNDPNNPPLPVSVTTQVSIRNLKDNL
ncbi:MAG: prepilin-type N-terminal cleavage/methylation domain-containing protein [Candidatus Paceibacterota bacterium]|jgi:prepilin-type N-terminal cleavage/methylation domain-containing protein